MDAYTFFGALVIAGVYLLFRFLEMRFVIKENKPLKVLLREALIVYLSVIGGDFILGPNTTIKNDSWCPYRFLHRHLIFNFNLIYCPHFKLPRG